MKKGFDLEAEGGEVVIRNSNGDYAVIPKNKVGYVTKLLEDDCHGCIDEYVATLPSMEDYAQDGTVVGDPLKPVDPPVPSQTTTPAIQSATLSNLPDWETDYKRRQQEYRNNPQNNGIPTLGGNWRAPSSDERLNLLKYYEAIPQNEIRNDQLEEYQSLLNNTYFVGDKPDTSGNFSKYIYAPTDIRKAYSTASTNPKPTTGNSVPNTMLSNKVNYATFKIAKDNNRNASASFQIAYRTPEEGARLQKDFANIKTEADLKKSPYYQYVGNDYIKKPTTPINFNDLAFTNGL